MLAAAWVTNSTREVIKMKTLEERIDAEFERRGIKPYV